MVVTAASTPTAAPEDGAAPRRPSKGPGRAIAGLVVLGVALRFVGLADKPFHHDESLDAWFSWRLVTDQGYEYDPVYHGPLRFYLTAPFYWLLGIGDFTARLLSATAGTALIVMTLALRRTLGTAAAVATAALLCLSPSFLYFSRFGREDIDVAALTLGLDIVVISFLRRPARWQPVAFAVLLALHFATKETSFITVFIVGTFVLAAGAVQLVVGRRRSPSLGLDDIDVVRRLRAPGPDAWFWAASAFAAIFTLTFTVFLTNLGGLEDGLLEGIGYWLSQHEVRRGGQPWFFYVVLILGYEWLTVGLAAVGTTAGLRRRDPVVAFLVWSAVVGLAVYSWAGEKFAWLVLHPLLPMVVLAGMGVQVLWDRRARPAARAGLGLAAVGLAVTAWSAYGVAHQRQADPRELLVSVQTADDALDARSTIVELLREHDDLTVDVDSWGGATWPWGWYLRDIDAGYPDMSDPSYRPSSDVVLVTDPNHALVEPHLEGYTGTRYQLRVWWVPEWGAASAGDWARWLVTRETWSPTGSLDQWIYVRDEVAPPA